MGFHPKMFKKRLLVTSIAAGIAATAGSAIAQQDDSMVEEVLVRGIKSSLERSLDIKRDSNQIVEAITADDIGKMPDQNIAESLQRLPGIQIDRRDGEGTKVRIRGLDQNVTLLNGDSFMSGMEYFQMGEWKQEFDSSLEGIPSELLGGVEVAKSPTAKMVDGGMGGIIDLKTRSGFDLNEMLVAGNVKVDQGMDSADPKPSGFFVFGNNWDDKFSAIVSLSMSQKTVHTDYIQNFSRENTAVNCTGGGTWDLNEKIYNDKGESVAEGDPMGLMGCYDASEWATNDQKVKLGDSYIAPGMFYVMDTEQERERVGGSVNLQWAVSDSIELGFDWFHSNIKIENRQYTVKHAMNADGASGVDAGSAVIDKSNAVGVLLRGTVTTPAMETNSAGEVSEGTADNIALKFAFDNGGAFRVNAAINMASGEQEQRAGYADSRVSEYGMRAYVGLDALVIDTPTPDGDPEKGDGIADATSATGWSGVVVNPSLDGISDRSYTYVAGDRPSLNFTNSNWLSDPAYHTYKSHWALGSDVKQDSSAVKVDFEYDLEIQNLKKVSWGLRVADREVDFKELRFLTDFSSASGVQMPTTFNEDGSVKAATTFDPAVAPGAINAGVAEAVYYDLCGNGGLAAGNICDIDGDGLDDNQGAGPYGYFLDAAIGLKAFDLKTSNGTSMAEVLYGIDPATSGRWDRSPGYLPWQTYTAQDTIAINQNGEGAAGDSSRYVRVTDFFRSGGYANSNVVFQDASKITADVAGWIDSIAPNAPVELFEVPLESWKVKESTTAFYGMADFEGDSIPYALNVGLRVVNTEVDVTSSSTNANSALWSKATDGWNGQGVLLVWDTTTETNSYWDVLPSLNFSLDTSEETKIRFTAAKVLARPNLQDLGKGFSKNYTRIDPTPDNTGNSDDYYGFTGGTAGNPNLMPYRASQADLAYEWYFGDLGYFSAGVFVKAVESFIANETRIETQPDNSPTLKSSGGVQRPFNGSGGSVNGFEIAFQQAFDMGFGYSMNYTYSANSADVSSTTNVDVGLPGVSENSLNLIGFYENDGISARVAYTWRDEFLSPDRSVFDVTGLENGASEFYDAYGQWDANVTWDVKDNISITAEAINILGEDQSSYLAYPNQPMTFASQEPRIVLGVNFRL